MMSRFPAHLTNGRANRADKPLQHLVTQVLTPPQPAAPEEGGGWLLRGQNPRIKFKQGSSRLGKKPMVSILRMGCWRRDLETGVAAVNPRAEAQILWDKPKAENVYLRGKPHSVQGLEVSFCTR